MTSKSARVVVNILNNTKGSFRPSFHVLFLIPKLVKISDPEERFRNIVILKHWKKNNVTGWIVWIKQF